MLDICWIWWLDSGGRYEVRIDGNCRRRTMDYVMTRVARKVKLMPLLLT